MNFAESGVPEFALGPADNQSVSLGDAGIATLEFNPPIANAEGYDFAVFENGFPTQGGYFLELAFVEVSSDGQFFVRFPATSLTDTSQQVNTFGLIDPTQINNLAGKYEIGYGTPFDLTELDNIPELDIQHITHIRLLDVIGNIADSLVTFDAAGRKINDPFPTPFPSGGFDLDAVGVIHQNNSTNTQNSLSSPQLQVYPNPIKSNQLLTIELNGNSNPNFDIQILNYQGQVIWTTIVNSSFFQVAFSNQPKGIYWLKINNDESFITKKIMVLD